MWWFEYACPMGNSTIRRCGFAGIGVALLEKVYHPYRWALRAPSAQALASVEETLLLVSCRSQSPAAAF